MEVGAVICQEFYIKIQVMGVLFDIGLQLEAIFLLDGVLREFISGRRGRGCIAAVQISFQVADMSR